MSVDEKCRYYERQISITPVMANPVKTKVSLKAELQIDTTKLNKFWDSLNKFTAFVPVKDNGALIKEAGEAVDEMCSCFKISFDPVVTHDDNEFVKYITGLIEAENTPESIAKTVLKIVKAKGKS
jgi:hypothetical protein